MKDRMERLVVLPFSMGCVSHSSVEVATTTSPSKKPKTDSNPPLFTGEYIYITLSLSLTKIHRKRSGLHKHFGMRAYLYMYKVPQFKSPVFCFKVISN